MRVLAIISLTIAATIFTYLIGATLATPVGQFSDDVTTVVSDVLRDEVDATTQVAFADEPVTGESVTQRARQDGEDEEDETTDAPIFSSTTKAPIPPPLRNESTVLTEFNFISQVVPVQQVAPVAAVETVTSGNPDDDDSATQGPAQEQESESESDSDNEISRDQEAATTVRPVAYNVLENTDNIIQHESQHFERNFSNRANTFRGEGRAGCECGKLPFKIPVDSQTEINPSPWLVAVVRGGLFAGGRPHCAGSLINNLYVLTTSSCMDGLYPTSVQVWLTAHDSFEHHHASFGNVKLNVQEIFMHPNYDRRSKDNDLCLLKLSQPVDISGGSYFVPACIPSSTFNFAGTLAQISGWSDGKAYRMCKAEMPILDNKICNRDSRHAGKITANMVCAGFLTPTRVETCIGDKGGPLVSPNNGRATLVGVVSWGYEAKNNDYSPTVYTRVSEFSEWILHNTRDADWCGT